MSAAFDADWLALRAAADAAARAPGPTAALQAWAERRRRPLAGVDLGCGTGANAAWLAPRLPGPQQWRLVDHDPALLARARHLRLADAAGGDAGVETVQADLGADPSAVLHDADLVTGAALLDLVSAAWLERLIAACAATGAAALFTLSYDGRFASEAPDADEARVRAAFNADQRRDKGLGGPALGPRAALEAARALRAAGYRITLGRSPWRLGPDAAPLQRALVDGWVQAAAAAAPAERGAIEAWGQRRRAAIDAGDARLHVGHLDLFAEPPAPR